MPLQPFGNKVKILPSTPEGWRDFKAISLAMAVIFLFFTNIVFWGRYLAGLLVGEKELFLMMTGADLVMIPIIYLLMLVLQPFMLDAAQFVSFAFYPREDDSL